jgi:hypothetical protein
MKNTRLLYFLFLTLLFQVTACGDKEDDPKPPTRAELLTAKTWKIDKILGKAFGTEMDITDDPMAQEYKDMQFTFRPDGTCTVTTPDDAATGNWAFAANETKLVVNPNTADEDTWDIVELKSNSLKLSSSRSNPLTGLPLLLVLELI